MLVLHLQAVWSYYPPNFLSGEEWAVRNDHLCDVPALWGLCWPDCDPGRGVRSHMFPTASLLQPCSPSRFTVSMCGVVKEPNFTVESRIWLLLSGQGENSILWKICFWLKDMFSLVSPPFLCDRQWSSYVLSYLNWWTPALGMHVSQLKH